VADDIDDLLASFDEEPAQPEPAPDPPPDVPQIPSITIPELSRLVIQPRPPLFVLHGQPDKVVLRERDYGMTFAERGIGKTWVGLGLSLALAAGGRFAHLKAVKPRRVLYVDGEMPLADMRDRINALLRGMTDEEIIEASRNFTLVNRELVDNLLMPSLTSPDGRAYWKDWLMAKDPAWTTLDNISSLTSGTVENNEEEWAPIGAWAIEQRRHRAINWIHHAGRSGTARGTSKREDPLDYVWKLSGVESQEASATITLSWKKGRNVVDEVKRDRSLQLHTGGPKEAPISVWNEISAAEGYVKEMDQRELNLLPIVEAVLRRTPSMGGRELRGEVVQMYKEKYGKGVRAAMIDAVAVGVRAQYEEAA